MRRLGIVPVLLVSVGLALAGCAKSEKKAALDPFAGTGSPIYKGKGPVPWGGGRYHVGKPYQVAGRWFTPKEQPNYDKEGMASWYGEAFNRRKTSNGEWFDMTRLTAAHPTLPLPSYVKVTNLDNGREAVVRVNDRGPFVGTRIIDLSKRTAEVLDFKKKGKAEVRVQYIGPAPLDDNGSHLMAMNTELETGTPMRRMIASADRRHRKSSPDAVEVAAARPAKVSKPAVQLASYEAPQPVATPEVPSETILENSYFVQIGSFADYDNAEQARAVFANVWPVQFVEMSGNQGTVYRVRLGPIASVEDAETALEGAVASGFPDSHVVRTQAMQAALQ